MPCIPANVSLTRRVPPGFTGTATLAAHRGAVDEERAKSFATAGPAVVVDHRLDQFQCRLLMSSLVIVHVLSSPGSSVIVPFAAQAPPQTEAA